MDVTIICATYNQDKYIKKAIEGILMQKGDFEYEILIHDDASMDNTVEILKSYKERYPDKITLILQEENQYSEGVDIYRTYVYPLVKGKYIAFCEGDDFWIYDKKLQKQYDLMESNPNISLCYHNALMYRKEIDSLRLFVQNHPSGYIEDKDIICATKGWYPTASFFGRADYVMSQPEFNPPTGDEGLRTYMACKGDLYFINGAWSVYRYYAEGSWNERYRNDKNIAAKYIVDSVRYFTEFNSYSKGRFSKYLHMRYMQAVIRYFGVKYESGYTVEEFENGLQELKSTSNHQVDYIIDEFHDEYIIRGINYYGYTVMNRIKSICQNGNEIYVYGAGAEAIKAIVELMRNDLKISGLIVTKKKRGIDTLLGYPIFSVEQIKFHKNMFIWPCLIDGREEVLDFLRKKQFCKILV